MVKRKVEDSRVGNVALRMDEHFGTQVVSETENQSVSKTETGGKQNQNRNWPISKTGIDDRTEPAIETDE